MKKIYTKSVFEFDKKLNRYVVNEAESEFYLADDDKPITQMKGGGSSQPQQTTTTTTQNNDPWSGQQPYLKAGFEQALNAFLRDRSIPGFSPESIEAQNWQRQRALGGNPLLPGAQDELSKTINGDYLYGGKGFDAALEAAKNKIMPTVDSTFARGGRMRSGLADVAKTGAIGDAFAGLYNEERNRQQRATALAPEIGNADYYDIGKLSEVGSQKDNMAENIRNERMRKILAYMQAINGNYGGTSTGTSTTTAPGANRGSP